MTSSHNMHPLHTTVRFFKVILTTTIANGKLKLPKNFTKKYGDGMSNPVSLKPPDGTKWKIHWTKHDGTIWFQKGWKEFATHYSLDHGHLLFFEYKGSSHFVVHIFNNSAVEVDYPCHDEKDNLVQIIADDSVEILDEHFSCGRRTTLNSKVLLHQPCMKMETDIATSVQRRVKGKNLQQHVQSRSTSSQKGKLKKPKLEEDKSKVIFNTECLKGEQSTSTALKEDTTFRSNHPAFKLVMKPSFINGDHMEIPQQFSEKYLRTSHAVVILEILDGRSWPVIYSAPRIMGGWQKFVSENSLNVGDVCIFELVQKIQGHAFKVSISRGAEEASCPISQGGSSSQRSSQLESYFNSKILTTTALEEANKFTSENPFFTVTLSYKRTNIIRCPHVPKKFVRKYFGNMKQNVMMIQIRKKLWPVKFAFSKSSNSGMLSAGWPSFARENELKVGDVCVFEFVNREDATLHAHVFRGGTKLH